MELLLLFVDLGRVDFDTIAQLSLVSLHVRNLRGQIVLIELPKLLVESNLLIVVS